MTVCSVCWGESSDKAEFSPLPQGSMAGGWVRTIPPRAPPHFPATLEIRLTSHYCVLLKRNAGRKGPALKTAPTWLSSPFTLHCDDLVGHVLYGKVKRWRRAGQASGPGV